MHVRRVVTGTDGSGESTVVSDTWAPRTHELRFVPGMSSTLVWATEAEQVISGSPEDPTPAIDSYVPEAGASRLIVLRIPPDGAWEAAAQDPEGAAAEQREVSPGLAELFEPEAPGMHTTDTIDYVIVLQGELWLDLGSGPPTCVRQGDIVIQNGTRHAWRNLGDRPALAAFVLLGAPRD